MFASPSLHRRFSLIAWISVCLAGCSSLNGLGTVSEKVVGVVTPYRVDIIQGNVVTREQYAYLKVGMPRQQVRDVLGSPLLTSVFHADRWDYVFTLRRQGAEPQARKVTVFFKNEVLERMEADDLPSEAEFVATLKSQPVSGALPALEASPESLKNFLATPKPAPASVGGTIDASSYPPLEPTIK